MEGLLKGKKTIVTGARGLARGMVQGLFDAGAQIAVISRGASGQALVEEGIAAHAFCADLQSRQQRGEAFEAALEALGGRLDILVNCAGVQSRHEIEAFPMDEWDRVLEVNLNAVWDLSQRAARVMIAQESGKIINIASMISFFGGIRIPAYAASKGGVAQLTKALAVGLAKYNIQVNALAPGYMDTEMNTALLQDSQRCASILSRIPAGRFGQPQDMAGPCVFLASSLSDYVNGAVLPVDGAYLVC